MASVTTAIKISFKTPQAQDDFYDGTGYNEDAFTSGVVYLSVMANDLGGAAKSLYSTSETSTEGATIWIATDGTVAYDATSPQMTEKLQRLNEGDHLIDTFTYSIQLGNGTVSSATVTIEIVGTNDVPVIVSAAQSGSVTEDGIFVVGGTVEATDIDDGAVLAYSGNANGTYGSFTVNEVSGVWEYTLDNNAPAVQALIGGDTKIEQFTVTVTDEHGATATQTIVITVHGNTDGLVPSAQDVVASGNEDSTILVTLAASDVDGSATYILTSLPENGILFSDGELDTPAEIGIAYATKDFFFVPDENFNGSVNFQYTVADIQGRPTRRQPR